MFSEREGGTREEQPWNEVVNRGERTVEGGEPEGQIPDIMSTV